MRYKLLAIAPLLFVSWAHVTYAQEDTEKLIEKLDPAIQTQIQRVLNALQKPGVDSASDMDVCRELQILKKLSPDKDKLVEQLAIFVATMKTAEDWNAKGTHGLILNELLKLLGFPPHVPIRVLAPYLEANNRHLRDSVHVWFTFHDGGGSAPETAPPITPVNYEDYEHYIELKLTHNEDVPVPFTKYIFERSPGRALLVFAYASSQGDITSRPQNLGAMLQAKKAQRREIELAEHIVSNAIWLLKNKFNDQFIQAAPEAQPQLLKLGQRTEWWSRLYVAHIMRKHVELRRADVWERLGKDDNELVREAAKNQ
jgi:hypothetical protein